MTKILHSSSPLPKRIQQLIGTALLISTASCGNITGTEDAPSKDSHGQTKSTTSFASERMGLGLDLNSLAVTVEGSRQDQRRAFAVTDEQILSPNFGLERVLNALARNSGSVEIATNLFKKMWATQGTGCRSNVNGAAVTCPRAEAGEGNRPLAQYVPIGLFNRFDMAGSAKGRDQKKVEQCGEYRVVYGLASTSPLARNLFILEANLPNPRPELGTVGCRPVAEFWDGLAKNNSIADRAAKLEQFYFTGISGFAPVLHADHLGASPSGLGQVRTNQFMNPDRVWSLRELKMTRTCSGAACTLDFSHDTVKTNPIPALISGTDAPAVEFQDSVIKQLDKILVGDLNGFNLDVEDKFNRGESQANSSQLYRAGVAFSQRLQVALAARGSIVSATEVVNRISALSCGGCHESAVGASMGGSLPVFPRSLGFTHVSETTKEIGEAGNRFAISPALTDHFLPQRQRVLNRFLTTPIWATEGLTGARVELCSPRDAFIALRDNKTVSGPTSTALVANGTFAPGTKFEWRYNFCGDCVLSPTTQTLPVDNRTNGTFKVRAIAPNGVAGPSSSITVTTKSEGACLN